MAQTLHLHNPLQGKRVLITGGTTGIGRATALLLAAQGARIFVFGRQKQHLYDLFTHAAALKLDIRGVAADVTDPEELEAVFDRADRELGGLDILVNNASVAAWSVTEGDYDEWLEVVKTNLLGYLACSHHAVDRMDKKGGHIVNIGSMSAEVREKGSSLYVATKSAIEGFSASLRKEVNEKGIKVTLIEPGAVNTDMATGTEAEKLEKVARMEMLEADDIAQSVLFALSQPKRCDIVLLQLRPHLQIL